MTASSKSNVSVQLKARPRRDVWSRLLVEENSFPSIFAKQKAPCLPSKGIAHQQAVEYGADRRSKAAPNLADNLSIFNCSPMLRCDTEVMRSTTDLKRRRAEEPPASNGQHRSCHSQPFFSSRANSKTCSPALFTTSCEINSINQPLCCRRLSGGRRGQA